jgi:hypothetical protein
VGCKIWRFVRHFNRGRPLAFLFQGKGRQSGFFEYSSKAFYVKRIIAQDSLTNFELELQELILGLQYLQSFDRIW